MKLDRGGITCLLCENNMGSVAHYCNQCGMLLPSPSEVIDPEERAAMEEFICSSVGHTMQVAISATARFCAICGEKIRH